VQCRLYGQEKFEVKFNELKIQLNQKEYEFQASAFHNKPKHSSLRNPMIETVS
jgi:hypothetical protein